jgi:hypothetical protein
VNGFIDHLQVLTANNDNIIAILSLPGLSVFTSSCLVMALTMVIPLLLSSGLLLTAAPFQLNYAYHRESESESELLYDWRFTANQFVLAPSTLRLTARLFLN